MELEPDGSDEPSLGWLIFGRCFNPDTTEVDLEAGDGDDEPSLGSHVLPSGAVSYSMPIGRDGSLDCEGDELLTQGFVDDYQSKLDRWCAK
jgi:hypothetical protein